RDPLPTDDVVDLPLVELLDENCTLIRKYPELFLSVVGLIHSFVDTDIRPNFLHCDDEEIGLLDFVKSADPFKVKTGERTLAQNEVPLLKETKDRVISSSAETISLVDHTIEDELKAVTRKKKREVAFNAGPPPMKRARAGGIVILEPQPTTTGKSLAAMQKLITQSSQNDVGSGPAIHPTKYFVSSSITQTPERDSEPMDTYAPVSPKSTSPIQYVQTEAKAKATGLVNETGASSIARGENGVSSAPRNGTGGSSSIPDNRSPLDDFFKNFIDHAPPPSYWAFLCNQNNAEFLDHFNVSVAQHAYMMSELR
ncbi:hypothetical protein Tco_1201961, partial [Tanacetum coccineum]